jgi:hypothetical protein
MTRTSLLEQERRLRERRQTRPKDWTDWDTQFALMRAEKWEEMAREALKRRRLDPDHIGELLEAANDARVLAKGGTTAEPAKKDSTR